MPWSIQQRGDEDAPFCVVNDETEAIEGCHATRAEAAEHMAEMYAMEAPDDESAGVPFTVGLIVEGRVSADRRYAEVGDVTWRTPPIPLMIQDRADHGGMGDTSSWYGGTITEVERDPSEPTRVLGRGFLRAGPDGERAEQMIRDGLDRVSIDFTTSADRYDVQGTDPNGEPIIINRMQGPRILAATVTPIAAFDETAIWLDGQEPPERWSTARGEHLPENGMPEPDDDLLMLLASANLARPPSTWFEQPEQCYEALADDAGNLLYDPHGEEILVGPFALDAVPAQRQRACALTVTDDGRVYGHAAAWGTCHIGYPEVCITPPESPAGYRYFHTGERVVAGGRVSCGTITLGTGHAGPNLSPSMSAAHYDDTGRAVADVRAKDGELGVWVAGAIRPGISAADVRTLMAAAPSGDWRRIDGYLEMVAVLAVNVPGFPIPRPSAVMASGVQTSLVAAGIPPASMHRHDELAAIRAEIGELRRDVAAMRLIADPLRASAVEALVARID